MSARSFQLLLESAYAPETPHVFQEGAETAYHTFEQAFERHRGKPTEEVNFHFERVRLGVAIAYVKAFTRLAHNPNTKEVLDLLQEALKASNTREIDKTIQKQIALFDNLYHEIFVNEQREYLLGLFEQTLDAGSKEEIDEIILEGLELLQEVDFDYTSPDEDDDEPLDEDFIKSIK